MSTQAAPAWHLLATWLSYLTWRCPRQGQYPSYCFSYRGHGLLHPLLLSVSHGEMAWSHDRFDPLGQTRPSLVNLPDNGPGESWTFWQEHQKGPSKLCKTCVTSGFLWRGLWVRSLFPLLSCLVSLGLFPPYTLFTSESPELCHCVEVGMRICKWPFGVARNVESFLFACFSSACCYFSASTGFVWEMWKMVPAPKYRTWPFGWLPSLAEGLPW